MTRYASFDQRDVVPLGYSALAFMLAAFVAVRFIVAHWVRPDLIAPAHLDVVINDGAGDWAYGLATGLFGSSRRPP